MEGCCVADGEGDVEVRLAPNVRRRALGSRVPVKETRWTAGAAAVLSAEVNETRWGSRADEAACAWPGSLSLLANDPLPWAERCEDRLTGSA